MKKIASAFLILMLILSLAACGSAKLSDGVYTAQATLSGGSGRASITKAEITVSGDELAAKITWSSSNYDYMIVDGETIYPENIENGSVFSFPISSLSEEIPVQADTVAMSEPHLIDYTITFDSSSLEAVK